MSKKTDFKLEVAKAPCLVINAPEFFQDAEFVAWLNNGERKFTWHVTGTPGEYSDTVVLVDPSLTGEGSDDNMPEHIWDAIVQACKDNLGNLTGCQTHIIVRVTNLAAG